jgi:HEAT repeat protein
VDIEGLLTGGDPRTLRHVDDVVSGVLADPSLVAELVACLTSADEIVRMRAADALEKVCRRAPAQVCPYVDRLLAELAASEQPSVRWHLAQIVGEVDLTAPQRAAAVAMLEDNLEHGTDWIVLTASMVTFTALARQDDSLRPYLVDRLRSLREHRLRSVARRATKLLDELSPPVPGADRAPGQANRRGR